MSATDEAAALEVTQADRDAACRYLTEISKAYSSNPVIAIRDNHPTLLAFARHRTTERDRLIASQERAIADAVAEAQAKIEWFREALQDVVNPVGNLQRFAELQGASLNNEAYALANDLSFVQNIARAALGDAS